MEFLREYALPLLYSFGACAGFCILFNLRGKKVFFAALGGAVSWLVYLLTRGLGSETVQFSWRPWRWRPTRRSWPGSSGPL